MTKAEVSVMCSTAFAVVLSMGLPALADEHAAAKAGVDRSIEAHAADTAENGQTTQFALPKKAPGEKAPAVAIPKDLSLEYIVDWSSEAHAADTVGNGQTAQFALPKKKAPGEKAPAMATPKALSFEYSYGSALETTYVGDLDLDTGLSDNSLIFLPSFGGAVTYRPTAWLETFLEATLEKPIVGHEEKFVLLPDGSIQRADPKPYSLLFDQAFVRLKPPNVPAQAQLTVGRVAFEDHRLWLYSAALDAVLLTLKPGDFQIDLSVSEEDMLDLDLFTTVPRGRIHNYFMYAEYRGVEDHKFNTYYFVRDRTAFGEGIQHYTGVRAHGRPSDIFRYWADFALVHGSDEESRNLQGYGFELGGTYWLPPDLPFDPSVTLSFAYGSGDGDPNDNTNEAYRQTGLQGNEMKFGGVTTLLSYGETLDPELSNIQIYTAGLSLRTSATTYLDLVYHHYRLNEIDPNTSEIRGSPITAQLSGLSKDVGDELDIVLTINSLFGVQGLGVELRAGLFFPGDAFRRDVGGGVFSDADKGISVLALISY